MRNRSFSLLNSLNLFGLPVARSENSTSEVQGILSIQRNTDGTTTEKRASGSASGNTWGWSSRDFASLPVSALVLAYVRRDCAYGAGLSRRIPAPRCWACSAKAQNHQTIIVNCYLRHLWRLSAARCRGRDGNRNFSICRIR